MDNAVAIYALVAALALSGCKKSAAPDDGTSARDDDSTTPAADPMAAGAKEEFEKKYSCPEDRVSLKSRSDIDPMQALAADGELKGATPPDEVKSDPARLAKWKADQDAERDERRRAYTRNSFFELEGCGHKEVVACHPHRKGSISYPNWADCTKPTRLPEGEAQDGGAMRAKLTKVKVNISLGTPGAKVFLVSGADRRELSVLPVSLDIDLSTDWTLVGTKPGYTDYSQRLTVDDGRPQKSLVVTLERKAK